jgi:hypothetical protein
MRILLLICMAVLLARASRAQSLEAYAGHQRSGVDLMWFKYFRKADSSKTPFLFFSRNRASVDYHGAPTLFGSTNAISYNLKNGLGLVAVGTFGNAGFTPKAGLQYYRQKGSWMFFGWLVADLKKQGNLDLFGLFRYQPAINKHWKLYNQLELFPVYMPSAGSWNLTQRIRLGLRSGAWAGGVMLDLNQSGKSSFTATHNLGGFLRYEF